MVGQSEGKKEAFSSLRANICFVESRSCNSQNFSNRCKNENVKIYTKSKKLYEKTQ